MSLKEQFINQYADVIDESVDGLAGFLKTVLDDRMAERVANAAERFARVLRKKDGPLQ